MKGQKEYPACESPVRFEWLLKALSLVSIMLGAFILGAGANLLAATSMSHGLVAGAGFLIGFMGASRGGILGMTLLIFGHVLLGSALGGGLIPDWLYTLGMPVVIPGIAYRIFRPE